MKVVESSPEVMGGTPVFRGTRVPVQTLLDYLEAGDSTAIFLADFPSVSPELVKAALQLLSRHLGGHHTQTGSQVGWAVLEGRSVWPPEAV